MNSALPSSQLIQFAASSVYSFLLFSIVIEALFKVFRIRSYRFRTTARLLLPLKLALAPFYLMWPKKLMLVNVNIFGCAHPLQSMLFKRLCECGSEPKHMFGLNTILENVLLKIPQKGHLLFLVIVLGYTLFRISRLCVQYIRSRVAFRSIMKAGKPLARPIVNIQLARSLSLRRVSLIASDRTNVPFAGFRNVIVIPTALLNSLSQSELETIISHELEHLFWKDTVSRFFHRAVSAVYWWIPLESWLNTMEHEQELACDQSINRYRLSGLDLASALKKTLKKNLDKPGDCPALADPFCLSEKENLFERLHLMLVPNPKEMFAVFKSLAAAIIIGIAAVAIGYRIC